MARAKKTSDGYEDAETSTPDLSVRVATLAAEVQRLETRLAAQESEVRTFQMIALEMARIVTEVRTSVRRG